MTLRTVSQLQSSPPREPAFGARLWKSTSQVVLPFPFARVSGRYRQREIYFMRGEKCVVRPYRVPRDPKTEWQIPKRVYMGEAWHNWQHVPAEVRAAWQSFAVREVYASDLSGYKATNLAGFNCWTSAQFYRQGMGLPISLERPKSGLPGAVLRIEEVPSPAEDAYAFRVRHGIVDVAGCSILFEISPAMPTMKRQPRDQDLRWAGMADPESFLPLGEDGALYLLPRARFTVEPGRLFGVRARVISPDGLAGRPLMTALIRQAPEPQAWTVESGSARQAETEGNAVAAPPRAPISIVGLFLCFALCFPIVARASPDSSAFPSRNERVAVTGTVIHGDDRPVSGALVQRIASVWPLNGGEPAVVQETRAASDGRYRMEYSEFGSGVGIRATTDGCAWSYASVLTWMPVQEGAFSADLVLEPACTVEGVVVGPERKPVTSATVTLVIPVEGDAGWAFPAVCTTGESGRFSFPKVPAGKVFLSALHPEYVSCNLETSTPATDCGITLKRDGASLSGRLAAADGEPLRESEVGLLVQDVEEDSAGIAGPLWRPARTDSSGAFHFVRLPAGRYQLYLGDPRSAGVLVNPEVRASAVGEPVRLGEKEHQEAGTMIVGSGRSDGLQR